MTSKLKDILLYSLAGIGICVILIATKNFQPKTPKWEIVSAVGGSGNGTAYLYNKETAEVWGMKRQDVGDKFVKAQKIEFEK